MSEILDLSIGYNKIAFDSDLTELVRTAKRELRRANFDTMIGTGLSGALVIPTFARAMNKNFAIVRKKSDSSHSSHKVEGKIGHRWIFVDDFVETGATHQFVIDLMEREMEMKRWETVYCGIYQYDVVEWRRHGPAWQPYPPPPTMDLTKLLQGTGSAV